MREDSEMRNVSEQLPIEFSIVVPTFNEKDNVEKLIEGIEEALPNLKWEIIFIDDDSPDGTADFVRSLAQSKPYVRCHQRIGRRGLSKAVIEGMLSSSAPVIAVMDADLQHDETMLPTMLDRIRNDQTEIVVGSRYCAGGSIGAWFFCDSARYVPTDRAAPVRRRLQDPARLVRFVAGTSAFCRSALYLSGTHGGRKQGRLGRRLGIFTARC